jgi:hypothetical protein
MRKSLAAMLAILAGLVAAGLVALAAPAAATQTGPSFSSCPNLQGWFVNDDETDRKPEATVAGLKFEPADLIHHQTSVALADLEPGTFTASPAPDQPSFFSVEVRDTTGAYGTLRHDGDKWSITIGAGTGPDGPATAGTFSDASPVDLLDGKVTKWGEFTETTKAVTFGVGYTKNPPGTVTTVVSSVTFGPKTYPLTCVQASSSASASASSSASPSTTGSASPSTTGSARPSTTTSAVPGAVPSLPVTGPSMGVLIGGGLTVLLGGLALTLAARRRKTEFTA